MFVFLFVFLLDLGLADAKNFRICLQGSVKPHLVSQSNSNKRVGKRGAGVFATNQSQNLLLPSLKGKSCKVVFCWPNSSKFVLKKLFSKKRQISFESLSSSVYGHD